MGVLGSDGIGADFDSCDVGRLKLLLADDLAHRVDRRMQVTTACIGLHVAARHGQKFRPLRNLESCSRLFGRRERLKKAVALGEYSHRTRETTFSQQGGKGALTRGMTGMDALDLAATVEECEKTRRRARSNAECLLDRFGILLPNNAERNSCGERTDDGRIVEAALARLRMDRFGDACRGLIACRYRRHKRVRVTPFSDREDQRRWNNDSPGVDRAGAIAIVDLEAVRGGRHDVDGRERIELGGYARNSRRTRQTGGGKRLADDTRDILIAAGERRADRIEHMPANAAPLFIGKLIVSQFCREPGESPRRIGGRPYMLGGRIHRLFSASETSRISSATTPSPSRLISSGLISASRTAFSAAPIVENALTTRANSSTSPFGSER